MEDKSGLKGFLSVSWVYDKFMKLLGAENAKNWLAENYWRLNGGEKVVDIGCGTGTILNSLPRDVIYVGFDISEDYIVAAQKNFGKNRVF